MSIEIVPTNAGSAPKFVASIWPGPLTRQRSARSSGPLILTPSSSSGTSELRPHSRSPSPAALVRSNSTSSASDGACPAAQRL